MKKNALIALLSLLVLLLAASCKPSDQSELVPPKQRPQASSNAEKTAIETPTATRKFRVGISLQDESPFVIRVSQRLESIVKEQSDDIELVIYNGKINPLMQIAHVESFISGGFDLVLLDPISFEECAPAVTIAKEAGIPIITFVTGISNQVDCLSFVGSSHIESGILEAQMVADYLNGNGRIVILEGVIGIEAQKARYVGYKQVFEKYPKINIVAIQTAAWQRAEAKAIVENWIESGKEFNVVVSENDNMAMGAIEAIEQAGLSEKVAIFGIDGDADALQAVKDGRMKGTVYHDADQQAKTLFKCITDLKASKTIKSSYFIPFEIVTQENVDYYMALYK